MDLNNFVKKYNIQGKIIKKEAYPIPFNGVKIHENNIALIGDAAGMANPFSKGGLAVNIYASKILVDCIENDNLFEYEKRIKNHIAFSKLYSKVCSTISEMSQEELGIIGEIVDGQEDMLNLKISAYFRALKHPKIIPKMLTIYAGFKEGIEYGW
jgi:flavin-dependent dehydrogenase